MTKSSHLDRRVLFRMDWFDVTGWTNSDASSTMSRISRSSNPWSIYQRSPHRLNRYLPSAHTLRVGKPICEINQRINFVDGLPIHSLALCLFCSAWQMMTEKFTMSPVGRADAAVCSWGALFGGEKCNYPSNSPIARFSLLSATIHLQFSHAQFSRLAPNWLSGGNWN